MNPEDTNDVDRDEAADNGKSEPDWGLSAGSPGMASNTVLGLILCLVLIGAFSFVVYKKWSNRPIEEQATIQDSDPHADDRDPFNDADGRFGKHEHGHKGHPHDNGNSFGDNDGGRQPFGADDEARLAAATQQSHGAFASRHHDNTSEPFPEFDQNEPVDVRQQSEPDYAFGAKHAQSQQHSRQQSHHPSQHGHTFFDDVDGETDPFGGEPHAQNVSASTAQNVAQSQSRTVSAGGDFDDPFGQGDASWQEPEPAGRHAQSERDDQFGDDAFGAFEPTDVQQQPAPNWEEPVEQVDVGQSGDNAFGSDNDDLLQDTAPPPPAAVSWDDGFGDSFSEPPEHQDDDHHQHVQHGQQAGHHGQGDDFGQQDQFGQQDRFGQDEPFPQHDQRGQHDEFGRDNDDAHAQHGQQIDGPDAFDDWPVDGGSFSGHGRELDVPHTHHNGRDPFADNHPNQDGLPANQAGHAVYVVQPSDNFWSISKKQYGTARYYKALSQFNEKRIPDPTKMRPGIKVLTPSREYLEAHYVEILPKVSGLRQVGGEVPSSEGQPQPPAGFFRDRRGRPMYRIGRSDTLSAIAQHHLGRASRWIQIYALNRQSLPTPHDLTIGTELSLPADASHVHLLRDHQQTR